MNTVHRTGVSTQSSFPDLNLKSLYPISKRLIVKRSIIWMLACVCAGIGVWFFYPSEALLTGAKQSTDLISRFLLALFAFCGVMGVGQALYVWLQRACFKYGIRDGQFYVTKGIIIKQRGSFPLSRITDLYIDQTFADLLFNLCSLHLSTPTQSSGQFARIEGLLKPVALALQGHLGGLLQEQQRDLFPSSHNGDHGTGRSQSNSQSQFGAAPHQSSRQVQLNYVGEMHQLPG